MSRFLGIRAKLQQPSPHRYARPSALFRWASLGLLIMATHVDRAHASCDSSLIRSRAAQVLFQRYQNEIRAAMIPKLKQLNWNGKIYVSVQNLPTPERWVAPHYMVRIDLENPHVSGAADHTASQVILRNKTVTTPLRFEARVQPETGKCALHLYAESGEYLVNQDQVPTVIYVPMLSLVQTLEPKKSTQTKKARTLNSALNSALNSTSRKR